MKLNKIFQKLKIFKPHLKKRKYQPVAVLIALFVLFLTFQNCGTGEIESPSLPVDAVSVTDLQFDTASNSWSWSCNKDNCEYRYLINSSQDHSDINDESYGSTTTKPAPDLPGNYYIHVQAKDTDTQQKSAVRSLSTQITATTTTLPSTTTTNPDELVVIELEPAITLKTSWKWTCNKPPCEFRHAINQETTHDLSSESYGEETSASFPTEPGTYYIHIQAQKDTKESKVARLSTTVEVPESTLKSQISIGSSYSCHLNKTSGSVKCWGDNTYGQLGLNAGHGDNALDSKRIIGDAENEVANLDPISLGAKAKFIATSERRSWQSCHTITDNDDRATCADVVDKIYHAGHTCAILEDDDVKCWGKNYDGQLGLGINTGIHNLIGDQAGEIASLGTVALGDNLTAKALALGGRHTCAILNNDLLKCWGSNSNGQLGKTGEGNLGDASGQMGNDLNPVGGNDFKVKAITAGFHHTCAILQDDTIRCWGLNGAGQLGYDDTNDRNNVANLDPVGGTGTNAFKAKAIAAGAKHTCAILKGGDDDNKVKCWGRNDSAQLGQGTITTQNDNQNIGDAEEEMGNLNPINLGDDRTAKAISAGVKHTCVLLDNNEMKCWGVNNVGQLGLGHKNTIGDDSAEMGDALASAPPPVDRTIISIAAGGAHSCYILDNEDESVRCWGHNWYGQLGQGYKAYLDTDSDTIVGNIGDDETITSSEATTGKVIKNIPL